MTAACGVVEVGAKAWTASTIWAATEVCSASSLAAVMPATGSVAPQVPVVADDGPPTIPSMRIDAATGATNRGAASVSTPGASDLVAEELVPFMG